MANLSGIITPTNVLTATSTNTVTNKTISGASNTVTNIPLGTAVTGTLPVANGGTGAASLTANNVLLGNGTSALQAVAPGTSGNVLTSNGTTWASSTPATGAMVFLSSVSAANSATVDIETGIGSTYDFYLLTFTDVIPTVASVFRLQTKIGGSYSATGYYQVGIGQSAAGTGSPGNNNATGSGRIDISAQAVSTSGNISGELWFSSPSNTTLYKHINILATITTTTPDLYYAITHGTCTSSTAALSGIRFAFASGNISSGQFRLYGIKNS